MGRGQVRALCFPETVMARQTTDIFSKLPIAMLRIKFMTRITLSILIGQLYAEAEVSEVTEIIGRIADGTPSEPAVKPELPNFQVKQSMVSQMDVVDVPEMSGLPPVKGRINVTVQLVGIPICQNLRRPFRHFRWMIRP